MPLGSSGPPERMSEGGARQLILKAPQPYKATLHFFIGLLNNPFCDMLLLCPHARVLSQQHENEAFTPELVQSAGDETFKSPKADRPKYASDD